MYFTIKLLNYNIFYLFQQIKCINKSEDLNTYLVSIGLPANIQLSISIETLFLLTNKQLIYTFYQDADAHLKELKPISLVFVDILQRLCIIKRGRMCYEHELLLYYVLKHLGFYVELIRCYVQEVGPYNPDYPTTHNFLHVTIKDEIFLIYIGFEIRSLRFPIKVDFQNLSVSYDLFPFEHFRITENETLYQLEHVIDGKWSEEIIGYRFVKIRNMEKFNIFDFELNNNLQLSKKSMYLSLQTMKNLKTNSICFIHDIISKATYLN
ncbi:unnamed protein product [Paramecium sonneborni]|uniref:Arylamine N-acetyltransferase n=1 Tax=Paramecium sonneborni TaxID=65129 RepID=A0A8S1QF25_9CILI|nr:unnamed protein product [Paramecium sonneborni]